MYPHVKYFNYVLLHLYIFSSFKINLSFFFLSLTNLQVEHIRDKCNNEPDNKYY